MNWQITASNLYMGNGLGILFGTISYTGSSTPTWGTVIGNFPGYTSNYTLPLLLYRTNGQIYLTAVVGPNGDIKLYDPDVSKIVSGASFNFQTMYVGAT